MMHNIISMPSCFMIEPFKGQACEDIFNGINSQAARKACPKTLWHVAAIKIGAVEFRSIPEGIKNSSR